MGKGWPIGFLVRENLSKKLDFDSFVEFFASQKLISPTYISICGVEENEGVIITRNRLTEEHRRSFKGKYLYLLQTNQDWWIRDPSINLIHSKERKIFLSSLLDLHYSQNESITPLKLWESYSSFPVWNHETIYTTLMIPHLSFCKTLINFKDPIEKNNYKEQLKKDLQYL